MGPGDDACAGAGVASKLEGSESPTRHTTRRTSYCVLFASALSLGAMDGCCNRARLRRWGAGWGGKPGRHGHEKEEAAQRAEGSGQEARPRLDVAEADSETSRWLVYSVGAR